MIGWGLVLGLFAPSVVSVAVTRGPVDRIQASDIRSKLDDGSGWGRKLSHDTTGGLRGLQTACSSDAVTISIEAVDSLTSTFTSGRSSIDDCYVDTGLTFTDHPYYTPSGTDISGKYIAAVEIDFATTTGSESSSTIRWIIGDITAGYYWCVSDEPAASVHPGDATWSCDGDDTVSSTEVIFGASECGGVCEGSAPTVACDTDTVSIISTAFPDFEGCYQVTTETSGGEPVFSLSGEMGEGDILLLFQTARETSTTTSGLFGGETILGMQASYPHEGDVGGVIQTLAELVNEACLMYMTCYFERNWQLGALTLGTIWAQCTSAVYDSAVHPAEASWSCDMDGDNFIDHFPSETNGTPGLFEVSCGASSSSSCTGSSTSSSESAGGENSTSPAPVASSTSTAMASTDAPLAATSTSNGDDDGVIGYTAPPTSLPVSSSGDRGIGMGTPAPAPIAVIDSGDDDDTASTTDDSGVEPSPLLTASPAAIAVDDDDDDDQPIRFTTDDDAPAPTPAADDNDEPFSGFGGTGAASCHLVGSTTAVVLATVAVVSMAVCNL